MKLGDIKLTLRSRVSVVLTAYGAEIFATSPHRDHAEPISGVGPGTLIVASLHALFLIFGRCEQRKPEYGFGYFEDDDTLIVENRSRSENQQNVRMTVTHETVQSIARTAAPEGGIAVQVVENVLRAMNFEVEPSGEAKAIAAFVAALDRPGVSRQELLAHAGVIAVAARKAGRADALREVRGG